MCGAQFGVAMPNAFVDRARDFTAFDVGRSDVAHGAHDGGSQGFYAVAVDDDQIGAVLVHKV